MTSYPSDADRFRPMIHRRDRRWEIHAGGKRFAIILSDHRTSATTPSFQIIHQSLQRQKPRLSITKSIGLVLAVIAGTVTIGIATLSTRANAGGSYIVSVPVPQRITVSEKPAAVARPTTGPRHRSVAAASQPKNKPASTRDLDDSLAATSDDLAAQPAGFTSRQAAIAAAVRTGSFQQWIGNDGDERVFIVSGPADNGCRQLSILVRQFGGADKVESRRECGKDPGALTKSSR